MFKVYNKDTRTIHLPSLWCLYCWHWAYFTLCFSISTANFEHTIAGWVYKWPSTKTIIFLNPWNYFNYCHIFLISRCFIPILRLHHLLKRLIYYYLSFRSLWSSHIPWKHGPKAELLCFHRSSRLEMLCKKGGTGCFPAKFAEFLRTPPLAAFCFQGIAKLKNGLEWVKLLNWGSDS